MWRHTRNIVVVLGAIICSVVVVRAGDFATTFSKTDACADGTVLVTNPVGDALCVDIYEASPATACPHSVADAAVKTQENISSPSCVAVSVKNNQPWTNVSYTQAQQLCARAGKRLLTVGEWHHIAIASLDASCSELKKSQPARAGESVCMTAAGVTDMVGNVWEWVYDTTTDGVYKNRLLPESGYVTAVDGDGVMLTTSSEVSDGFGGDYAWGSTVGVRGMLRGGYFGSGADGGIFAQNNSVELTFAASGVGFRCVYNL